VTGAPTSLARERDVAIAAARAASDAILRVYATDFDVAFKAAPTPNDPQGDPVTLADRASNALIIDAIHAAFPDDFIVTEESDLPDGWRDARRCWFVDPLDGTRDFVQRNGEFCVMVGLAVEGVARLGVVVGPAHRGGVAIVGVDDALAWLDANGLEIKRDRRDRSSAPFTLAVTRSRREANVDRLIHALGGAVEHRCGSVGLKVAAAVAGEVDGYVHVPSASHPGHGPKLWDSCAPEAIARAAGLVFTDLDGVPIDYRSAPLTHTRGLVAADAATQAKLVRAAKQAQL
jgi:3'(2'), 5'-bisphosphate nucleotidase